MILLLGAIAAFFTFNRLPKEEKKMSAKKPDFYIYDDIFKQASLSYGVPFEMLKSICMNESSLGKAKSVINGLLNPKDVENSKSTDGLSWGLMQVTITTAKDYDSTASPEKLNNPSYSVNIAARHLRSLRNQFMDERNVVMAYNQGAGNQRKFLAAEKLGTLSLSSYLQARLYWERYQSHKKEVLA